MAIVMKGTAPLEISENNSLSVIMKQHSIHKHGFNLQSILVTLCLICTWYQFTWFTCKSKWQCMYQALKFICWVIYRILEQVCGLQTSQTLELSYEESNMLVTKVHFPGYMPRGQKTKECRLLLYLIALRTLSLLACHLMYFTYQWNYLK